MKNNKKETIVEDRLFSSHKPTKITDSTLDLVEKLLSMLLST